MYYKVVDSYSEVSMVHFLGLQMDWPRLKDEMNVGLNDADDHDFIPGAEVDDILLAW